MQVSAEIRWFWKGRAPDSLEDWFLGKGAHRYGAGGGASRTDKYLRQPAQTEVGLKLRGGNDGGVEVKGLISQRIGDLSVEPFAGPIEVWTKWTVKGLDLDVKSLIVTEKKRWLRKFDTTAENSLEEIELNDKEKPSDGRELPSRGCNVELTLITGPELTDSWWTFCFESFGTILTVESDIRAVVGELSKRRPPVLRAGLQANYPVWLDTYLPTRA
jgi:hypothetical protein